MKGLLHAKNSGATIVIAADADQQGHITKEHISRMLQPLLQKPGYDRAIHPQMNGGYPVDWRYSGHYAIRMSALDFLFEKGAGGKFIFSKSEVAQLFFETASGAGLELAFFYSIPVNRTQRLASIDAIVCSPHKKGAEAETQDRDIERAMEKGVRLRKLLEQIRQPAGQQKKGSPPKMPLI